MWEIMSALDMMDRLATFQIFQGALLMRNRYRLRESMSAKDEFLSFTCSLRESMFAKEEFSRSHVACCLSLHNLYFLNSSIPEAPELQSPRAPEPLKVQPF
jgi:hypothetical protein